MSLHSPVAALLRAPIAGSVGARRSGASAHSTTIHAYDPVADTSVIIGLYIYDPIAGPPGIPFGPYAYDPITDTSVRLA